MMKFPRVLRTLFERRRKVVKAKGTEKYKVAHSSLFSDGKFHFDVGRPLNSRCTFCLLRMRSEICPVSRRLLPFNELSLISDKNAEINFSLEP